MTDTGTTHCVGQMQSSSAKDKRTRVLLELFVHEEGSAV